MSRTARALLGICVLAGAVRFATLGIQGFDYDESFTVGIVLNGSLGHVFHAIPLTESSPPLYYVLAWFWGQLFGLGEYGIRSLSALLGTAVAPVAFLAARRFGGERAGVIAGVLVALNPLLVWYSQEARTYALLALLGTLSLWAFTAALDRPEPRRMAVWAACCAAALLSHYFAGFLIAGEAAWLICATRRHSAVLASGCVAAVGVALLPLLLRQADHRTEWIANLSFGNRIREVTKKLVTGEIDPTHNWQLAIVAVLVGSAMLYAGRRLSDRERHGAKLALGTGGGAIVIPFLLDLAGLHYLISKNVMAAVPVLLIGAALILGARAAPRAGLAGAAVGSVLFLAITLDGALDPALQRPDYRSAARTLGLPLRDQVIVTAHLGDMPTALYRPGAQVMPVGGWLARQVIVVRPLARADEPQGRPPTPPAPPGFTFAGRRDARTYTLICFGSSVPRRVTPARLPGLIGSGPPNVQVWPGGTSAVAERSVCAGSARSAPEAR